MDLLPCFYRFLSKVLIRAEGRQLMLYCRLSVWRFLGWRAWNLVLLVFGKVKLHPEFAKIYDDVYANHVKGSDVRKCVCEPGE
jgi:hypothetical protein